MSALLEQLPRIEIVPDDLAWFSEIETPLTKDHSMAVRTADGIIGELSVHRPKGLKLLRMYLIGKIAEVDQRIQEVSLNK